MQRIKPIEALDPRELYAFWLAQKIAPAPLPFDFSSWNRAMFADADRMGRQMFIELRTLVLLENETITGYIQYGYSAYGFDAHGLPNEQIHYPIIRGIAFDGNIPERGEILLRNAMEHFANEPRVYAFFHYFGLSCCARHGKLHERNRHIERLLRDFGFVTEHENIYFSRSLKLPIPELPEPLELSFSAPSGGSQSFRAELLGDAIGGGKLSSLPAGIVYLDEFAVASARRNQGYGTKMLSALLKHLADSGLTRIDLDTARNNLAAIRLYEKCGFVNFGITRSFFTE